MEALGGRKVNQVLTVRRGSLWLSFPRRKRPATTLSGLRVSSQRPDVALERVERVVPPALALTLVRGGSGPALHRRGVPAVRASSRPRPGSLNPDRHSPSTWPCLRRPGRLLPALVRYADTEGAGADCHAGGLGWGHVCRRARVHPGWGGCASGKMGWGGGIADRGCGLGVAAATHDGR